MDIEQINDLMIQGKCKEAYSKSLNKTVVEGCVLYREFVEVDDWEFVGD